MSDRVAALAEALEKTAKPVANHRQRAAAILAELPSDWCGHHDEIASTVRFVVEIARLREALAEIVEHGNCQEGCNLDTARAALAGGSE